MDFKFGSGGIVDALGIFGIDEEKLATLKPWLAGESPASLALQDFVTSVFDAVLESPELRSKLKAALQAIRNTQDAVWSNTPSGTSTLISGVLKVAIQKLPGEKA